MKYQQINDKTIVGYYDLKAIYPNTILAKNGTQIIENHHSVATTAKPAYDVYTQKVEEIAPVNYVQTWNVVDLTQLEIDAVDAANRVAYEDNMNSVMLQAQMEALGDPAIHRYTQGMTRYSSIIAIVATGGTPTQEESDFAQGAEYGLSYQEVNALNYSNTVVAISALSGQAILDYPMPSFTMSAAAQTGYQPYLDYLDKGFI